MIKMDWVIRGGEKMRHKTAKQAVANYLNEEYVLAKPVMPEDLYIVWFCKTLQNWKALLSTDLTNEGIYFEVTYNGDKDEIYLDHYKKQRNLAIKMNPVLRDDV